MKDFNQALKDTFYVAVGFGVIAFQKAQVRRHEVAQLVEAQLNETREQAQKLAREVEHRVEPVIDQLEERLPEQARDWVRQARTTARPYVRSWLGENGKTAPAATSAA